MVINRNSLIASILLLVILAGANFGQAPKRTAVRAARLLDVRTGGIVNNPVVLVENGRITAAGAGLEIPAEVEVMDLGDVTLLPGLIDAHTHLLQNYYSKYGGDDGNMILTLVQMGTTKRALLGAAMGREMLEAGFTTVRDLGNSGVNGDVALRDAVRDGWVTGPRIFAATRALSGVGGQFGRVSAETQNLIEQEYVVVNGTDSARRAVRQAIYDGADWVKVIVNNGSSTLSLEEMKAIVDEAHQSGRKVAAHASGDAATRIAAEAGVDSIEHAYTIPDDALKIMAEKKIFLVPTDYPADFYLALYNFTSDTPAAQVNQTTAGVIKFVRSNQERISRALKAGVRIAAGSDQYYAVPRKNRGQSSLMMFQAYAASGMSPLEIIRAATINNAELLAGERASFGTIEKSKYADIIAVPGDPLKDITTLERVTFVMKAGTVVKR